MSNEGSNGPVATTSNSTYHQPQSSDACTNIVQSLLNHSCGESDFSRRAIESLVKKMKEKREELDALITAITTGGAVQTLCVTIQRTLDGRLQVAGRKGFPHVIYARIWRWPDLTRNELRPTKNCAHAFKHKSDLICVNPYHYDRVVVSPGIDLSSLSIDSPEDQSYAALSAQSQSSPPANNSLTACGQDPASPSIGVMAQPVSQCLDSVNTPGVECVSIAHHSPPPPTQLQHHQPVVGIPAQHHTPGPAQPIALANQSVPNSADVTQSTSQYLSHPLPEYWCSISYFELDQQVGETFRVASSSSHVTIDGFTNPAAPDRFCIGFLSNVHRPQTVQKARLHIGKGVRLESRYNGDVWLQNLSDNAVFLSSPYLDQQSRRTVGNAVHKIYPRANLKVFDLHETHLLLSQKAEAATQAAAAQAAAVTGTGGILAADNSENIGVDDLRRFCILSLSFVKGWGLDYPRNSIKDCPCWVEVHLNRALQLLDEVLQLRL